MENLSETKRRYIDLIKAICEDSKDDEESRDMTLDFIDGRMKSFIAYEQSIQNSEILIPVLRFTKDGEELKDKIMELDNDRRNKHDVAIGSLNSINRKCQELGVKPISPFTYEDFKTDYDRSPLQNRDFRDAVEEFAVSVARDFSNDEMYQALKEERKLNDIEINHEDIMKENGLYEFIKEGFSDEHDINDKMDIRDEEFEL